VQKQIGMLLIYANDKFQPTTNSGQDTYISGETDKQVVMSYSGVDEIKNMFEYIYLEDYFD